MNEEKSSESRYVSLNLKIGFESAGRALKRQDLQTNSDTKSKTIELIPRKLSVSDSAQSDTYNSTRLLG